MFSDHARLIRQAADAYDHRPVVGRFITEALLAELKEDLLAYLRLPSDAIGLPIGVLDRDLDLEAGAVGDIQGVRLLIKDDGKYARIRVNVPARGADTRQVVVIADVDAIKVKPHGKSVRAALEAALHEWSCETDEGSLFAANHPQPTIADLAATCTDYLVPHSLVRCLRHHGIGEMWIRQSEREATYEWFIDDKLITQSMKGHN